jgi:hypothetical protein
MWNQLSRNWLGFFFSQPQLGLRKSNPRTCWVHGLLRDVWQCQVHCPTIGHHLSCWRLRSTTPRGVPAWILVQMSSDAICERRPDSRLLARTDFRKCLSLHSIHTWLPYLYCDIYPSVITIWLPLNCPSLTDSESLGSIVWRLTCVKIQWASQFLDNSQILNHLVAPFRGNRNTEQNCWNKKL